MGGRKCRLAFMFALTTAFFLVEITVGYVTNSMALVADSFHMLSDVVSLVSRLYPFFPPVVNGTRLMFHIDLSFAWKAKIMCFIASAIFTKWASIINMIKNLLVMIYQLMLW